MIEMYTKDDQGLIEYHGPQGWTCDAYLLHHDLQDVAPEFERLQGWPHSQVRWYRHAGSTSQSAIGFGV